MKKICILVNRIWEFIQHSHILIQRRMTISLSFSVWDSKDHNRKIWIQNYEILSFTKYTTKQLCLCLSFTLVEHRSSGKYFLLKLVSESIISSTVPLRSSLSPVLPDSWDSGACAVFCHDAHLFLSLCSSPLTYCCAFLIWSNSSLPSFNLLIPFLSLQNHYWSALLSFGFRFLHLF